MSDPRVRANIEAFVAAWNERDASLRAPLLERACAEGFRMITAGRCVYGRDGLDALIADFHRRRPGDRARFASAVEVHAHTFRYLGAVERPDGPPLFNLDTGEHDGEGRLLLVLTFAGATPPPGP